mgnify:CR=1 FL=1
MVFKKHFQPRRYSKVTSQLSQLSHNSRWKATRMRQQTKPKSKTLQLFHPVSLIWMARGRESRTRILFDKWDQLKVRILSLRLSPPLRSRKHHSMKTKKKEPPAFCIIDSVSSKALQILTWTITLEVLKRLILPRASYLRYPSSTWKRRKHCTMSRLIYSRSLGIRLNLN